MKNLKIFVLLAIMILGCVSLQAQEYEVTFNGFGGLSTLNYKIENVDAKIGWAGGGGFSFGIGGFKDGWQTKKIYWGFLVGVEAALYEATTLTFASANNGRYAPNVADEATFLEQSEKRKQRLWMIQIPIMAQVKFRNKKNENLYGYLAFGGKLGIPIEGEYLRNSTQSLIRKNELLNFEAQSYPANAYSEKNSRKFSTLNPMASIEGGIRWMWDLCNNGKGEGHSMGFYIGFYVDYGFLNIIPKKTNNPFYTSSQNILAHQPNYNDPINSLQRNDNDMRYIGRLNTWAMGAKFKLSFFSYRDKK